MWYKCSNFNAGSFLKCPNSGPVCVIAKKKKLIFSLPDGLHVYLHVSNWSEGRGLRGEAAQASEGPDILSIQRTSGLKTLFLYYWKLMKLRMIIYSSTMRNRAVRWTRVMEIYDQLIFSPSSSYVVSLFAHLGNHCYMDQKCWHSQG